MEKLIVTNAGQSLIAKLISGTAEINFTKIKTSDYVYTASDIPALTELSQIRQTANVSSITIVSSSVVKVRAVVNNTSLSTGYYVKAVGLYATDSSTNEEILFGVSLCGNMADYMPSQSGTVTGITYTFNCKVDNTEQVAVTVDPSGVASAEDLEDLEGIVTTNIANILSRVTSLENDLKEYIQMGGFKKYKEAGTYTFKVPVGITSLKVSAIGGGSGGSGGGGYDSGYTNGGGGGSGGHGYYVLDEIIHVTAGESLTVVVGTGGIGGTGGQVRTSGNAGGNGGQTKILRSNTVLLTVNGGLAGTGGGAPTQSGSTMVDGVGGTGGMLDGNDGENGGRSGGSLGGNTSKSIFGNYGAGGAGGTGGYWDADWHTYDGTAGESGTNGALLICYGGISFEDVKW